MHTIINLNCKITPPRTRVPSETHKKYLKLADAYKTLLLELFDFAYTKNIMPMKFNIFYDKDKINA